MEKQQEEVGNNSLSGVQQNFPSSRVNTEKGGGKTFSLEQANVNSMTNTIDKVCQEERKNMERPEEEDQNGNDKANMRGKDICERKDETSVFLSKENVFRYSRGWRSAPTCNICGRKFRSLENKEFHEANHNIMKYKCACGFLFLNFQNFRSHLQSAHEQTTKASSVTQNPTIVDAANHTNKSNLKCHLASGDFVKKSSTKSILQIMK